MHKHIVRSQADVYMQVPRLVLEHGVPVRHVKLHRSPAVLSTRASERMILPHTAIWNKCLPDQTHTSFKCMAYLNRSGGADEIKTCVGVAARPDACLGHPRTVYQS